MNEPAVSLSRSTADVRALLFDTFGTVVDWRSGIARDAGPFLARHGIAADPHEFADAWRARYQPAMEEVRSGGRPFTRLDLLHRENLDAVLRDFGADPGRLPADSLDDLNRAWHRLDPWPDCLVGLTRLRARFIIAPLSNGNLALLLNMAKRARLPWDAIFGADVSRSYKPQREAYTRTAEALGLAPAECMMVAAHNSDLRAARNAGLATAFVLDRWSTARIRRVTWWQRKLGTSWRWISVAWPSAWVPEGTGPTSARSGFASPPWTSGRSQARANWRAESRPLP